MRVLHIVENLNRGAVENWLVRMFCHGCSNGVELDWTFYCALGEAGVLDKQVRKLGGRIVHSQVPIGRKIAFMRALRAELRAGGYDVLHCHHDLISGLYLMASTGLPIKKRFVHVHNADEAVLTPSALKQRLLRPVLRQLCLRLADSIIGISNHTLESFLKGRARRPGRDRVHYYGIDPSSFLTASADRLGFRKTIGLPANTRILLFAGRMVPEKNPLFAVDLFAAMCRRDPDVVAVFVGAGSLEDAVFHKAKELGVADRFRMLGWRNDIPEIMTCCDWFILPRPEHPQEGLGIAVVEAQLAGLRLLLSKGIPDDALLPGSIWSRLPLAEGAECWADEAIRLGGLAAPQRREMAGLLGVSPFDMDFALRGLCSLYSENP
jgi:glycosyltransferase involved in cell wall biosynthesis